MGVFDWLNKDETVEQEGHLDEAGRAAMTEQVIAVLKTVFDPEIPVNIYDLGLIYELHVNAKAEVHVMMTLTAPGCPVAQTFPGTVEDAVRSVAGVCDASVELTWEPPWDRDRMSEAALLELGML